MRFTPIAFMGNQYTVIDVEYLIVGGGGAGGNYAGAFLQGAGHGGAGGFLSGSIDLILNPTYPYQIIVGEGGGPNTSSIDLPGTNGTNSIAFALTASGGGGGGGPKTNNFNGLAGGSGGGAGWFDTSTGAGGDGIAGQGFAGANAFYSSQPSPIGTRRAGCGGGAATTASAPTLPNPSIAGAPKAWVDGQLYAGGGPTYTELPGSGGPASPSAFAQNGSTGIVKIRYAGTGSQFTGGTIEYSGSYTYHTFRESATLTPTIN
jgi:hypothetical protein